MCWPRKIAWDSFNAARWVKMPNASRYCMMRYNFCCAFGCLVVWCRPSTKGALIQMELGGKFKGSLHLKKRKNGQDRVTFFGVSYSPLQGRRKRLCWTWAKLHTRINTRFMQTPMKGGIHKIQSSVNPDPVTCQKTLITTFTQIPTLGKSDRPSFPSLGDQCRLSLDWQSSRQAKRCEMHAEIVESL